MQFLVAPMRHGITHRSALRASVLLLLAAAIGLALTAAPGRAAAPVEALIPSSAPQGSPSIDLTLRVRTEDLPEPDDDINENVTSFALLWNGARLPAIKSVTGELTTFTARVAAVRLGGAPGARSVQAANCAGMTCRPVSAAADFTITPAPTPVLSAISPARIRAGKPAFTLVVTGSGFGPASLVEVDGTSRMTEFVSTTRLTARVPAPVIAVPDTVRVRVVNPPRLGGASNRINLRVTAPPAPGAPTITSIAPTSAVAGSGPLDLRVTGSGFDASSRVRFDGVLRSTTFVSSSRLVARLPASALTNAGPEGVSVVGSAGGNTGSLTFLVIGRPEILALDPGTVVMDGGTYTLTVTGVGFDREATVQLDGTAVPTTFVGSGRLRAIIGPERLAAPGAVAVRVVNPQDKGGASSSKNLVVQLAPEPVVPAVPEAPPKITEVAAAAIVPGEVVSIGGMHFGRLRGDAEVLVGDVPAELAGKWGDARIDIRVPDLPAGEARVTIRTVRGTASRDLIVSSPPAPPPVANPVLLPSAGGRIVFDASTALDPVSGAGPAGDNQANAVGLTGITAILWRFGDGTTSTDVTPTKAYTRPGTYSPSVTVTTQDGRRSTTSAGTVRVRRGRSGRLVATPPPVNFSIPSRVVFDAGESTLRPESRAYLLRLAALVKRVGRRTEVGGHSDGSGSFEVNQRLSIERARAVRNFLVRQGRVPQGLLTAVGYGETRPITSNATALGRQRNRRVELRIDRGTPAIRLTARQLLINQRISQAAIARANALEKRLTSGLSSRDIRDGSLMPQDFGPSVAITGQPALATGPGAAPPRLKVTPPRRSGKRLVVSEAQLLINQRISQAAVRRVNRLDSVLDAGLTGAAIRDGGIAATDLVPNISAARDGDSPAQGGFVLPALRIAAAATGKVKATQEQLIINQRVSQAAIRRLNLAIARFEKGLTSEDFRDGSLSANDLET